MAQDRNAYSILVGNLRDLGIAKKPILKWTLKEHTGRARTGLTWLKITTYGKLLSTR
jgi:hypothetical protein